MVSFGSHGQHGTRSGAHDTLGNAPHENVGQTSSSVRGEYDQVDIVLAGILNDLHFWRSLHHGWDHRSTCRPLQIENTGQGFFRLRFGLADVFWQVEAETKVGRRRKMDFQRVQ